MHWTSGLFGSEGSQNCSLVGKSLTGSGTSILSGISDETVHPRVPQPNRRAKYRLAYLGEINLGERWMEDQGMHMIGYLCTPSLKC